MVTVAGAGLMTFTRSTALIGFLVSAAGFQALAGEEPTDLAKSGEVFREFTYNYAEKVEKPGIAFKVLAAGAIDPRSGSQYAFEHGADFIAVGVYDFEIGEDAAVAEEAIRSSRNRARARCGPAA